MDAADAADRGRTRAAGRAVVRAATRGTHAADRAATRAVVRGRAATVAIARMTARLTPTTAPVAHEAVPDGPVLRRIRGRPATDPVAATVVRRPLEMKHLTILGCHGSFHRLEHSSRTILWLKIRFVATFDIIAVILVLFYVTYAVDRNFKLNADIY